MATSARARRPLLVWGRQSYRLSDNDFKAASRDGYGDDWPIRTLTLPPYYEHRREICRNQRRGRRQRNAARRPISAAMKMSCGEILLKIA